MRYGFLGISIVLTLLIGSRLALGVVGTAICSGFVFDKRPSHVMPADLARTFDVAKRP